MDEPWAGLGRDLHHLGVANSLDIPKKLYEMGWRKHPTPTPAVTIEPSALAPIGMQQYAQLPTGLPEHILKQRWVPWGGRET